MQLNLFIAFLSGLSVFSALVQKTSETQRAVLFGYSLSKAALLVGILALLSLTAFLLYKSLKRDFWTTQPGKMLEAFFHKSGFFFMLALMGCSYLINFSSDQILGRLASYRGELYPIAFWCGLLSLQLFISLALWQQREKRALSHIPASLIGRTLTMFGLMGALAWLISITRVGLIPDVDYWQGPGVPLLFYQVLAACAVGMAVYSLENSHGGFLSIRGMQFFLAKYVDLFICIILWAIAFVLWASYPVKPSYGSLVPTPPNFQSYPFADALLFDINAQNYWIGIPIPNDFWEKPFYSFFLALLHGIAGQDYNLLARLQVAVFALNPVLLYLIVKVIANRAAGTIAGLLIIFRELNGLALSNIVLVSHSKLLMSDIFAMELILLLIYILMYWARDPQRFRILPLVAGGVFGFLVLVRGHALLLFPLIILSGWLVKRNARRLRYLLEPVILLSFGLCIVLGSWMWRSYEITGEVSLQNPISTYTTQIARLYSLNPLENPERFPGEDDESYYGRIKSQPLEFLMEHPREVARFVSAHYFHNLIFSYLYLPQSLQIESPVEFVKRVPFWSAWDGALPKEAKGFLVFNLTLLSIGLVVAWKTSGRLLVIPLLLGVGYNLSVSVGRLSGWRLIQPVDWITLIFYAAGLVELAKFLYSLLTKQDASSFADDRVESMPIDRSGGLKRGSVALIALLFAAVSWGVTKGETLTSTRYYEKPVEELILEYASVSQNMDKSISADELEDFMSSRGAVAYHGKGLYPSYLSARQGELNYFFLAFEPRPYKRLAFQLIGPAELGVILPLSRKPEYFPSGADVVVFGCLTQNPHGSGFPAYVEALLVIVKSNQPFLFTREPTPSLVCPFPEPD